MVAEHPDTNAELRRRLEQLAAQVATNRADIDALMERADAANHRADQSEARADASEVRADESWARADASEQLAKDDRSRIDELEARADVDAKVLAELQADGILNRERAAQLEVALRSSRRIGAAIGIVMADRKVSEEHAFAILVKASQDANRKVRVIADEVVRTGDVSDLPRL